MLSYFFPFHFTHNKVWLHFLFFKCNIFLFIKKIEYYEPILKFYTLIWILSTFLSINAWKLVYNFNKFTYYNVINHTNMSPFVNGPLLSMHWTDVKIYGTLCNHRKKLDIRLKSSTFYHLLHNTTINMLEVNFIY